MAALLCGCSAPGAGKTPTTALDQAISPVTNVPNRLIDAIEPSNHRDWKPNYAVMPYIEMHGDKAMVRNVRYCKFKTASDYTVEYYDKEFDLDDIQSVDIVMIPFAPMPQLAHVEMSFGFKGGEYLGVSVEARREKGEDYDPILGLARQFELMYVLADERDMIRQNTDVYLSDVYIYRLKANSNQARAAFLDMAQRVNTLIERPEHYNTLTNNCTTNLVAHMNKMYGPDKQIRYSYEVMMPGAFDQLLYGEGLIDTSVPFLQAKELARINKKAYAYGDGPDFSTAIRSGHSTFR